MNHGKIFCVGLGPGDPDMMSVKADRLLRNARHVAYFRKRGHPARHGNWSTACCMPRSRSTRWSTR